MKKRIWNQLKKAVVVTVLAGIMGNCTVSAAEFEAQELAAPEVLLQQSAEWTDEKNFQAEIRLEVSGLKELYKKTQDVDKGENVQESGETGDFSMDRWCRSTVSVRRESLWYMMHCRCMRRLH